MTSASFAVLAACAYLASTAVLWRSLRVRSGLGPAMLLGGVALAAHAAALATTLFTPTGLALDVSSTASLVTWEVAALLGLAVLRTPIASLGLVWLPVAAIGALTPVVVHAPDRSIGFESGWLIAHVLLSLLAYGLLTLAMVQALALAWQERGLRRRDLRGVLGWLPPLTVMEELLFQMIAVGVGLLTLALATGLVFVEDVRGQHLSHKVVLSWLAWATFIALLWGRWRHGWRGRTAINWTLVGVAFLGLAYFGSRFVLEMLLGRSWG